MNDIKETQYFWYSKDAVKIDVRKCKNQNIFHSISFLNFGKWYQLGLPAEIRVQIGKTYETCMDRCKLCHIKQTEQTTTWKETCIQFKIYVECRLWANMRFSEIFVPKE